MRETDMRGEKDTRQCITEKQAFGQGELNLIFRYQELFAILFEGVKTGQILHVRWD